jgi:hypothetical protein
LKVPPSLIQAVLRIIASDMLWLLRDKTPKTKYPKHYAAIAQEAKKWGVKLPRGHQTICWSASTGYNEWLLHRTNLRCTQKNRSAEIPQSRV